MSIQTKTVLKSYFEDGDSPSGSNFTDLIDSLALVNAEYANVTAALTPDDTYHILFCSGTFTVTLPVASSLPGKEYCIKNTGTGLITLAGTIDDAVNPVLSQYSFWWIKSDGTNWQRIGGTQNKLEYTIQFTGSGLTFLDLVKGSMSISSITKTDGIDTIQYSTDGGSTYQSVTLPLGTAISLSDGQTIKWKVTLNVGYADGTILINGTRS